MKALLTADERGSLVGRLDLQRAQVRPKCEGLSETDAEMFVDYVPLAQLLDEYDAECARSNEILTGFSLDDVETLVPPRPSGQPASTRYILNHMIEETARHLGHLDILTELLDGRRG